MEMDIHQPREHMKASGVDFITTARQFRRDLADDSTFDGDVRSAPAIGVDHSSAADDCLSHVTLARPRREK
jgi:hypothetical protein